MRRFRLRPGKGNRVRENGERREPRCGVASLSVEEGTEARLRRPGLGTDIGLRHHIARRPSRAPRTGAPASRLTRWSRDHPPGAQAPGGRTSVSGAPPARAKGKKEGRRATPERRPERRGRRGRTGTPGRRPDRGGQGGRPAAGRRLTTRVHGGRLTHLAGRGRRSSLADRAGGGNPRGERREGTGSRALGQQDAGDPVEVLAVPGH